MPTPRPLRRPDGGPRACHGLRARKTTGVAAGCGRRRMVPASRSFRRDHRVLDPGAGGRSRPCLPSAASDASTCCRFRTKGPPMRSMQAMPVQHEQSVRLASAWSRRDARASPPRLRGAAALTRPAARQCLSRYVLHGVRGIDVTVWGRERGQPGAIDAAMDRPSGCKVRRRPRVHRSVQRLDPQRAAPSWPPVTERAAIAGAFPQTLPLTAPVSRT